MVSISGQAEYARHSFEVRLLSTLSEVRTDHFLDRTRPMAILHHFLDPLLCAHIVLQELRVAYLKFGRMMNSDELDKLNGATTPAPLLGPGLGVTTPIAPSASALFGSSTFGSTTPFTAPQHKLF